MRRRNYLIWLGVVVTFVGAVSYFMVFARFPALRDFPWVNLPLVLLGAALSGAGVVRAFRRPEVFRNRVLGVLGLTLSTLLAVVFVVYIFWYSYWIPGPTTVTLGLVEAPDFTLASADGGEIRLGDYRGRKVVLVFYRGFW